MDVSSVSAVTVGAPDRQPGSGAAPDPAIPAATASAAAQTSATALLPSKASPSPEKIARAVNQVNDTFKQRGQSLYASFEKDRSTGIDVVKIVDQKTHETITQLPIKAVIAFAQSLEQQGSRGKLVNATA